MSHTEDDTFRVLVRPSRKDMSQFCEEWCSNPQDYRTWRSVLEEHHWTWDEWYQPYEKVTDA